MDVKYATTVDLNEISGKEKEPQEKFHLSGQTLDFSLVDFWKWNQSDLIENRNRGILAEYIVKQALKINNKSRLEWDDFDLITSDGKSIEVKSAAYIQTWKQKRYSTISFSIAPNKKKKKRCADFYVFCLLHHKEQNTINAMDLSQWTFYIVPTTILDQKLPNQKSIRLSSLEKISPVKCSYTELPSAFDDLKQKSM